MDDAELVREVIRDNCEAYDELIRRYTPLVASRCRTYISRPEDVDDLVQETFLRGFVGLPDLREPERFGSWILTIARNLCLEWLRDPHNRCQSLEVTPSPVAANINDES